MKKIPISVVILTKNEEANIEKCIKSVQWASEVVVVDDESTDRTVEIAKRYTDKVVNRKMDIEGRHRNYAYSLASNDWVLSLDADEVATEDLQKELARLMDSEKEHVAYTIPIRAYIGDHWIRYGGWYPASKLRLFQKATFRYEEVEVHPKAFHEGSCGHLRKDIIHYSYRDFHDFFTSLNNQTTLEAKKWFNEKRKIGFLKMTRKFIERFIKGYLLKKGYKDGIVGFVVAYGGGLYQLMSYVKYQGMIKKEKGEM